MTNFFTTLITGFYRNLYTLTHSFVGWFIVFSIFCGLAFGWLFSLLPMKTLVLIVSLVVYLLFDGLFLWKQKRLANKEVEEYQSLKKKKEQESRQRKYGLAVDQFNKLNNHQKNCLCFSVLVGKPSAQGKNIFLFSSDQDSMQATFFLRNIESRICSSLYDNSLLRCNDFHGQEWEFDEYFLMAIRDMIKSQELTVKKLRHKLEHPKDNFERIL